MRRPGNLIFSGRLGARAANLAAFSQQSSGQERREEREWAKRNETKGGKEKENGMENDERGKRRGGRRGRRFGERREESRGPCFDGPELCIVKRGVNEAN